MKKNKQTVRSTTLLHREQKSKIQQEKKTKDKKKTRPDFDMDLVLVYAADSFSVALFARAADRSIERLILAF